MRIRTSYITTLMATGAAAFAIAAAPTALADTGMSCNSTVSGSECQSPDNVQFDDSPPNVGFDPYGDYGLALGGFGGGGGFHGGGHGR
jgi:hypothetical protein